jgi:hypothetical protein
MVQLVSLIVIGAKRLRYKLAETAKKKKKIVTYVVSNCDLLVWLTLSSVLMKDQHVEVYLHVDHLLRLCD